MMLHSSRHSMMTVVGYWLSAGGFVAMALWLTQAVAAEPTAAQLMQAGHDGRAAWHGFPGFEAKLTAATNGRSASGHVTVAADGKLKLDLSNSEGFEWITRTLDSLVGHRLADSDASLNVEFADDDATHPMGRLIRSKDPAEKSLWRVRGDVMTEVHRFTEKTHFVISVSDVLRTPDGRHLPQDFTVTTWDKATGDLISSRQVHTEWKFVDGVAVPSLWWAAINTGKETRTTQRLELSEPRLLARSATTAVSR